MLIIYNSTDSKNLKMIHKVHYVMKTMQTGSGIFFLWFGRIDPANPSSSDQIHGLEWPHE